MGAIDNVENPTGCLSSDSITLDLAFMIYEHRFRDCVPEMIPLTHLWKDLGAHNQRFANMCEALPY